MLIIFKENRDDKYKVHKSEWEEKDRNWKGEIIIFTCSSLIII